MKLKDIRDLKQEDFDTDAPLADIENENFTRVEMLKRAIEEGPCLERDNNSMMCRACYRLLPDKYFTENKPMCNCEGYGMSTDIKQYGYLCQCCRKMNKKDPLWARIFPFKIKGICGYDKDEWKHRRICPDCWELMKGRTE